LEIPIYQVDAFSKKVFGGNPAAICVLDQWLDDNTLQSIAAENNLSETAYLVKESEANYKLRWFTPTMEIDLCGHATLASAFVILTILENHLSDVSFDTRSGVLKVSKAGDSLSMDFPAWDPTPYENTELLNKALNASPLEVHKTRDLMAVFESESVVRNLKPNMDRLLEITETLGLIVTAPGDQSDFVSRFFAPWAGIPEDPVTGSAFCTLTPYWSKRLNKKQLHAYQVSERKGEVHCEYAGDRVRVSGQAALYSQGVIYI
jgi:PhzF family phenazine biosynthesis protein